MGIITFACNQCRLRIHGGGIPKIRALDEAVAKCSPTIWVCPPPMNLTHHKAQVAPEVHM